MLTTNANFDAKHDVDYKWPAYLFEFDGKPLKYSSIKGITLDSQNYTSFVEEEESTDFFSVASNTITFTSVTRDESSYVYLDCGMDYFCSDFEHKFNFNITAMDNLGIIGLWMVADTLDDAYGATYGGDNVLVYAYRNSGGTYVLYLQKSEAGSPSSASQAISASTDYYITVGKDTSVGTYGEIYCEIYTDAARTALVARLTRTLTKTSKFQYLYGIASWDSGSAETATGTVSNLECGYADYILSISGLSQKVTPEEGKASIGGFKVGILNVDNEITALLATDSYYFHRKKATIKAGYLGMTEADMLQVSTVWVTDYEKSDDGTAYVFDLTDPKKWMQRKIFRGSETTPVTISGNPINILLAVLTSTGAGTNGDYDWYAEENGLGIDEDNINVSDLEAIRDDWFPGDSHYMKFTISERIVAKDFVENEICKVLNCYPIVDGQGRFSIRPFKPPIASRTVVQSFNDDNIRGIPKFDANLESVVNEVEVFYDYDSTDDEFDTETFYVDADSVDNRGPGKRPITIKTKGLYSSLSPSSMAGRAEEITTIRKQRIFGRFATPPTAIKLKTHFSRWLSDAGDIVPITCTKLPDIPAGTLGLTANRMEIINRSIDWVRGEVSIDLLDTGFARDTYGAISPTMTITTSTASTCFTVSTADAEKYANFTNPEVQILDSKMRQQAASITITNVDTTTGLVSCDDMGAVSPINGYVAAFADYDNCSTEQQLWNFVADSSNDLGTGDDNAHIICP